MLTSGARAVRAELVPGSSVKVIGQSYFLGSFLTKGAACLSLWH